MAIKKFKDEDEDEALKKNMMREIKYLRLLKHENIVDFKEFFKKYQVHVKKGMEY